MYRTRKFWSTNMLPRHHQQFIRIFIKIRRKYKMEKELQKIEPKNGFNDAKLEGGRPHIYKYIE